MAHILLIEDNIDIGSTTQEFLEYKGHTVQWKTNGKEGLEESTTLKYDIILLDVMLPEMDGFEVLHHIRKKSKTPVCMLTAKGELDDKKVGFGLGIDDYITKPFDLEELHRRIESIIKRTQISDTIIRQDIQIFTDENKVTKGGKEIRLTQTEFSILMLVLDNDGHTITKTDIIETLWGGEALREHTNKLEVHIHNLRKKLHKDIIITIPGVGFRSGIV